MAIDARVDPVTLRNFVESSGLSYTQNSRSWIFTCPRCGKAKKLYLQKRDGRFVCWRCKETDGFKGRPEFALAELLGVSVAEIQTQLYGGVPQHGSLFLEVAVEDFFGDEDEVDEEIQVIPIVNWPLDFYPIDHARSERGVKYLDTRGIPLEIAKQYDIHYAPSYRSVFFPVNSNGRLYGWQGRLVVPHQYVVDGETIEIPKTLSSKGLPREQLLMFSDRLQGSQHAIVTEGPIDAIKAHLCGGNIATMGKAVSRGQIELLRNSGVKRIYLGLDPDAAEEMTRLVREFYGDIELYDLVPNGAKDLGDMSFKDVYKAFLHAPVIQPWRLFVFLDPTL